MLRPGRLAYEYENRHLLLRGGLWIDIAHCVGLSHRDAHHAVNSVLTPSLFGEYFPCPFSHKYFRRLPFETGERKPRATPKHRKYSESLKSRLY